MVKFTLEFTKTYLDAKDANTIPLSETMFDPPLLLSHRVFLLGTLFRYRAFREPELVSARQLDGLDVHSDEPELRIPLRRDLHDKVGEIIGLEIGTIPYYLRYNAGNEFDQSVSVSDALRNLMLGHANSNPFQRHYLGREICADPWALLRGRTPQQGLVKQSCSVAHSISKRRPLNLTAEQSASVLIHPLIRKLTGELRGLPQDSARYLNTRRKLRNAKQTLRRELRERIRDEWTDEQAVDDIRRQLRGIGFAKPIAADAAPTAYCVVQEGRTVRRAGATSAAVAAPSAASEPPQDSPVILAATSIFVKDEKERPRRCFLCVGAALALELDHPLVEDLIHEFYTPSDLSKHFRRKHLKNHALLVHGTVS
ncbi:C2H2 finger domain protein [Pleurostoma richardsiae]|uniref:C2H2 finger domain protein n=1 Tax=Pleurostoma richardsiae TaxID=41990 RepID=A0AA38RFS5_9PEZI|nr:C2H2 finger domain protein [Pleurostoma richardsiae]